MELTIACKTSSGTGAFQSCRRHQLASSAAFAHLAGCLPRLHHSIGRGGGCCCRGSGVCGFIADECSLDVVHFPAALAALDSEVSSQRTAAAGA